MRNMTHEHNLKPITGFSKTGTLKKGKKKLRNINGVH